MTRGHQLDNSAAMQRLTALSLAVVAVTGCRQLVVDVQGEGEGEGEVGEGEVGEGEGEIGEGEGEGEAGEGEGETPGTIDEPIVVDRFPFFDARDTRTATGAAFDAYSCAPSIDESGPAFVYRLDLPGAGRVQVSLDEDSADRAAGVDVDVHLLSALRADACLARGNVDAGVVVDAAGSVFLIVDTYVDDVPQAGAYGLTVTFSPASTGNCAVDARELEMVWSSCGTIAGCSARGGDVFLQTPVTGPVVKEAHLVTVADDFGGDWPTSFTDGIVAHYALSADASDYDMARTEPWAPAGEGGSEFGQGSTGSPLPVVDEAWYVNMYWASSTRPARGTRMIITNPQNGRTVVASAGWETGPGSSSRAGGASEEIHHALGTGHGDTLRFAFAIDQTLPFGPIVCE